MMWELIAANKRKSIYIFIGMGLLLILIGFVFGSFYSPENGGIIGIFLTIVLWGILSMISYFAGSKILLAVSGAKEVTQEVHPQLFNVVEEMRIAANLPNQPKVYIIADAAPNAFATGIKPDNTAIAVTAGLLGSLNRDELQGVVAHEMSHIMNRDVLLMTFAGMMLGTITLMSEVFTRSLWFGGGSRYKSKSSDKNGQGQIIILVLAIALAILGPIMAQLLYFAISRKREYLADASAVRLTRYPDGLASALEKISSTNLDLKTANKVTAPMYIINPLKKKGMQISNLSSTHPPITERINILRSMTQGVNYTNYQAAFNQIKGRQSIIIPQSGLTDTTKMGLRSTELSQTSFETDKQVKREVGDLMMKLNDFFFIDCTCGIKIKVPPDFKSNSITCPRCGRVHTISV
ncbi:MAG TPA: M48 family metallopeptidase [Ignavibacteriaceae bacterium]|nr:M48 family metallopeptidase [Ignavibacteriaceae bacterium]HRN26190.1 M48 family metallopeptidase [Ignavibacteriaceae bacterium]HRP92120.1 M48 family metallopeptidase [Ignavibacteriaceae bacterium]HRQ53804.1 M48 family metallopeptidase [Ignavibacteriaceae bacterium]